MGFIGKTGSVGALFGGDDGDAGPFGVPEAVPAAGPGFVEAPSHARAIGADVPGSPTDAVSRGVVSPTRATSNPFGGPGGDDDDDDDFFSNLASPTAPAPATPPFGAAPPPNASFAAATTGPASIATSATTAPAHHAAAPTRFDEVPAQHQHQQQQPFGAAPYQPQYPQQHLNTSGYPDAHPTHPPAQAPEYSAPEYSAPGYSAPGYSAPGYAAYQHPAPARSPSTTDYAHEVSAAARKPPPALLPPNPAATLASAAPSPAGPGPGPGPGPDRDRDPPCSS